MTEHIDSTKGERVRMFFDTEANMLYEQYKNIEKLIPARNRKGSTNPGEEGRYIESLLRGFLNTHLPHQIRAYSGFILRPATKTGYGNYGRVAPDNAKDMHSSQLDIIVYNSAQFPIYHRFEEFVIVPPEGVVGIVSVKKTLRISSIKSELRKLENAARLCHDGRSRGPYLGLFAFTCEDTNNNTKIGKDIFQRIEECSCNKLFECAINEVSILDRLVVYKYSRHDAPNNKAKYVRIDCKGSNCNKPASHVPIQRLIQSILAVFHHPSRLNPERPGFVSFEKGIFGDAPELGLISVL